MAVARLCCGCEPAAAADTTLTPGLFVCVAAPANGNASVLAPARIVNATAVACGALSLGAGAWRIGLAPARLAAPEGALGVAVTAVAAPVLSAVSPRASLAGAALLVSGSGFADGLECIFSGTAAPAAQTRSAASVAGDSTAACPLPADAVVGATLSLSLSWRGLASDAAIGVGVVGAPGLNASLRLSRRFVSEVEVSPTIALTVVPEPHPLVAALGAARVLLSRQGAPDVSAPASLLGGGLFSAALPTPLPAGAYSVSLVFDGAANTTVALLVAPARAE